MRTSQQFEFLIRFTGFSPQDLEACVEKLPRAPVPDDAPHYELRLESDGFYFHDLARSDFSASILRIVMELALEHSDVQIEGFGSGACFKPDARLAGAFTEFDELLDKYRDSLTDSADRDAEA